MIDCPILRISDVATLDAAQRLHGDNALLQYCLKSPDSTNYATRLADSLMRQLLMTFWLEGYLLQILGWG